MFNLPNAISLLRIILLLPCLYYFDVGQNNIAMSILFIMIFSDIADGIVARKFGNVSDFGKMFDPLCDKIAIFSFFIYLVLNREFPLWFLLILVSRDIVLTYLGALVKRQSGNMPQANVPGKIMVNTIGILIIGSFMGWHEFSEFGLFLSVVFLAYSTFIYLSDYKKILTKS